MCNCERSVINEKYWNGTFCANAGDKWSRREKDYQCKSHLECLDKISRCYDEKSFLSSFFKSNASRLKFEIFFLFSFEFFLFVQYELYFN